jgi:hypothetical protein
MTSRHFSTENEIQLSDNELEDYELRFCPIDNRQVAKVARRQQRHKRQLSERNRFREEESR